MESWPRRITLFNYKDWRIVSKYKPYVNPTSTESEWLETISYPIVTDREYELLNCIDTSKEEVHRILHSLTR